MLHYDPQHVSSSTLLILRRTNYITTASGIVTLEIGERSYINLLKPNDIYVYIHMSQRIYIYIHMSYRSPNLQTVHFKYLFNKYTY